MSYILDALRRAEAQRSRGRLPGLHEAAGGGAVLAGPPTGGRRRSLQLILLLLMLAGLLVVGLMMLREPAMGTDPVAGPTSGTGPAASAAPAGVAAVAAALQSNTASAAEPELLPLPRNAVLADRAVTPAVQPPKPPPAASAEGPPLTQAAGTGSAQARPDINKSGALPASRPAAATVLPSRKELPPDVQRSLPAIVVSGTVYSPDPVQRMLVVNGELWREGDQIGPELVLEQIRPRDVVLRFRGVRFTVSP